MKEEILKELQEALAKTDCHMLNVIATSGKTIAIEIITPFIKKILEEQKEEIIKRIERGKRNDFREDGFCNFCNGHKDNMFHKERCELVNETIEELKEKLEKL